MSSVQPPTEPIKPERTKKPPLPESSKAYQQESQGGLLKSEEWNFWDWFIYIITFQWVEAIFSEPESHKSDLDTSYFLIQCQKILSNRIPTDQLSELSQGIKSQSPQWRNPFTEFLDEAERLDALPNRPSKEERGTIETLYSQISQVENHLIRRIINEIFMITTAHNTQVIDDTLNLSERSKPYLFSINQNEPFSLLYEIRTEEKALYVTDPKTSATRRVVFDPNDPQESRRLQLAEAIHSLSHSAEPQGSPLTDEQANEKIKKGDLFLVKSAGGSALFFSPALSSAWKVGLLDKTPLSKLTNMIRTEQAEVEISIPIAQKNEIVKVKQKREGTHINLTFEFQGLKYVMQYTNPFGSISTFLNDLSDRHVLERDLLLARSYFLRNQS